MFSPPRDPSKCLLDAPSPRRSTPRKRSLPPSPGFSTPRKRRSKLDALTPAQKSARRRNQVRQAKQRHSEKKKNEAKAEAVGAALRDLDPALLATFKVLDDGVEKQGGLAQETCKKYEKEREELGKTSQGLLQNIAEQRQDIRSGLSGERQVLKKQSDVVASATNQKVKLLIEHLGSTPSSTTKKRKKSNSLPSPMERKLSFNSLPSPKPKKLKRNELSVDSVIKFKKFITIACEIVDKKQVSLQKTKEDYPRSSLETIETFLDNITDEDQMVLKGLLDTAKEDLSDLREEAKSKVSEQVYSLIDGIFPKGDENVARKEFVLSLATLVIQEMEEDSAEDADLKIQVDRLELQNDSLKIQVDRLKNQVETLKEKDHLQVELIGALRENRDLRGGQR